MEVLSAEILRITECPYTPSLKTLHGILQRTEEALVHRWARGNACQIKPLVTAVLEALELWPYALDLLRVLGSIPPFRDAVMQQKPVLLDTLLRKSLDSDQCFDKYGLICTAMLSTPLNTAVPSYLPIFLEKLFEKAVSSPSSGTIRPVYLVLSGVGSIFLDDLPFQVVARFQDQLTEMLSKVDTLKDPLSSPLCLATAAKFLTSTLKPIQNTANSTGLQTSGVILSIAPTERYLAARKFFTGKKAHKALDIAVLGAINVCSNRSEGFCFTHSELFKLYEEIVAAVDIVERRTWLAMSNAKTDKLPRKIQQIEDDPDLQCMVFIFEIVVDQQLILLKALNFFVSLTDPKELPPQLCRVVERLYTTPSTRLFSAPASIVSLASLRSTAIGEILMGILRLAMQSLIPENSVMTTLDNAQQTVSAIAALTSRDSDLRSAILDFISTGNAIDILHEFANQEPPEIDFIQQHSMNHLCPFAVTETKVELHRRLVILILSIALRNPPRSDQFGQVLDVLLERKIGLSTISRPKTCMDRKLAPNRLSLSLFETDGTPPSETVSHDWGGRIIRELSRDATRQYESITRMVGEICRDLESRCEEAERPYRAEQSKRHDLEQKLQISETGKREIVAQARAQLAHLDAVNSERDGLSQEVEAAGKQLKKLFHDLENARDESKQIKRDAEAAAQAQTNKYRESELAYLATLTGKDEDLDDQHAKLASSEDRAREVEHQLKGAREELVRGTQSINAHEATIARLGETLAEAQAKNTTSQNRIECLLESEAALIFGQDQLMKQVQELSEKHDTEVLEQQEKLQVADQKMAEMEKQQKAYIAAKDAEVQHLQNSHKVRCNQLEAEMVEASKRAAIADEQSSLRISTMQNRITKLRKKHEEQAKELADIQEASSNFMKFMGHTHRLAGPPNSRVRRSQPGKETPRNHLGTAKRLAPDTHRGPSPNSSSSSKSQSTPKRTKISRSSQSPASYSPTSNVSPTPDRNIRRVAASVMKPPRTPLAELSPSQDLANITPTQRVDWERPEFTAGKVRGEPANERMTQAWHSEDESFGSKNIFTSTAQLQIPATGDEMFRPLTKEGFDGTTTEF